MVQNMRSRPAQATAYPCQEVLGWAYPSPGLTLDVRSDRILHGLKRRPRLLKP